jgi:hypothetical protein
VALARTRLLTENRCMARILRSICADSPYVATCKLSSSARQPSIACNMRLDIRRRSVKIWATLSGLWIVCVLAIAAIEAVRSARPVERFAYSLQLDQLAPSGSTQAGSFPEWFFTERDFPQDGITLVLPLPEPKGLWKAGEDITAAVGKDERGPGEAYQTSVPSSAVPELIQRAKRLQLQRRIEKFGVVLKTALLPPALLLMLGLAISWATKRSVEARKRSR